MFYRGGSLDSSHYKRDRYPEDLLFINKGLKIQGVFDMKKRSYKNVAGNLLRGTKTCARGEKKALIDTLTTWVHPEQVFRTPPLIQLFIAV